MLESNLEDFNDQKLQLSRHENESSFKLPKIEQPNSRGQLKSKAQKRATPILPNIHLDLTNLENELAAKSSSPKRSQNGDVEKEGFAMEIEQKLKLVLDNVQQGQQFQEDQDEDEEDFDFEAIVNQNKQILKQQKQKNQLKIHSNNLIEANNKEEKKNKAKSKTIKQNRNDSIYQKKIKEFREMSTENKYIQKKKQIIAQKLQAQKAKMQLKQKDEPMFIKNNHQLPPKPSGKYSLKDQKQEKSSTANLKSDNLFDNIQNFLENPQKSNRSQNELKKFSKEQLKQLEEKLRSVNEKLGVIQNLETKESDALIPMEQKTVRDWKRIEIKSNANLRCVDSNFEKEMDRINTLQEKNSQYISQFVEHQKLLVELRLIQKMNGKMEKIQNRST